MPSSPDGEESAATSNKPDRKPVNPWLLGPSLGELLLLYLALGVHLAMGTDAVVPFFWWMALWGSVWIAGFWFGLRIIFALLTVMQGARGVAWRRWFYVACAIGVFFTIHTTTWGFTLRVWISETWIREDVDRIQSAIADDRLKNIKDRHRFASDGLRFGGFMEPELMDILDNGKTILWRTARGDSFFQSPYAFYGGLMYCESGKPPSNWSDFYVDHLYGPWWRWRKEI
jgi:hypothetical protein